MLITEMCGDAIDRSAAGGSETLGRAGLPRFHFQALGDWLGAILAPGNDDLFGRSGRPRRDPVSRAGR